MRKRRLLSQAAGLCAAMPAAALTTARRALGWSLPGAEPNDGALSGSLRWVAGELPPYAWNDSHGPTGLAYELVREMSLRLQRELRVDFYPWARALREARENRDVGVFPVGRTAEREQLYRWLIPLGRVRQSFFGKPEVDVDHLESLLAARIGVLRGSFTAVTLAQHGFKRIIDGADYAELLRMLDHGIVDAVYATDDNFLLAMRGLGRASGSLRQGLTLGSVELYVAASRHCTDAEALRWQQAYRELVADGTVARLEHKYLATRVH